MNNRSPWPVIIQVAAAFALVMGIGRFVYTPILPLMTEQAGLSASGAALLATMNYIGYLIGAAAGIIWPRILTSSVVMKTGLAVSVLAVALMPLTDRGELWGVLRLVSGIASAVIFMAGVAAMIYHLGPSRGHLSGWGMAGVGIGIALCGASVLVIRSTGTWQTAWYAAAGLGAILAAVAWRLVPERTPVAAGPPTAREPVRTHPWFAALLACYTLEGIGYIIAGTFLVAAIDQRAAEWVGSSAWILVGISSSVAVVIWMALSRRISRISLLAAALTFQLVGVALPALWGSASSALIAAVLFGGTFVPVAILTLGIGAELEYPRAVAILTTGYSVGQILGPLIVAPMLHDGYVSALLVGAGFVFAALIAALLLRIRYPVPAR